MEDSFEEDDDDEEGEIEAIISPFVRPVGLNGPVCLPADKSLDLPSVGSRLHSSGQCRPCIFIRREGCSRGRDCLYCHLCPAGEVRKRKKNKQLLKKIMLDYPHVFPLQGI